ncbi:MAG: hypothetical protein JWQ64_900 [Subtercola sp.]|nr:hypothetical protein [Subtercola sp.]
MTATQAAPAAPTPGVGVGGPAGGQRVADGATPTVRAFFKQWSFWVGAGVFVVLASLVLLLVRGGTGAADSAPLSITSPAPGGSQALAEVLRQQGVTVTAVNTLDAAQAAVAAAGGGGNGGGVAAGGAAGPGRALTAATGPTVLIYDPDEYLPGDRYDEVSALGARLVLVQPDIFELEGVAPSISLAGPPTGPADNSTTATAGCTLPAAQAAGSITISGTTYRPTEGAAGTGSTGSGSSGSSSTGSMSSGSGVPSSIATAQAVTACFETGGNAYSVVESTAGTVPVTVLGSPDVLTNEQITTAGNAALALGLLGQSDSLVWYTPSAADVLANGPPSLGALTPGWVTPLILLLVVVFIASAVWRGRRLGPVVVENLPVIVRGNETVTGRARLYARSGARLRALDALRIGTSGRLAGMLGLPRRATLDEIILQTSAATGIPAADIASVLVNRLPSSEADLLALSRQLADVERVVRQSVYGSAPPTSAAPSTTPSSTH